MARNATAAPVVIGSSSDCAVATLGPFVLLLWRKRVAMEGPLWVQEAFANQLRERPEEKIMFLTVVESGCEVVTDGDVRQRVADLLKTHEKNLAAAAIVFEQQGFRMTMVRSIITAINLASRTRFPNSVFADVHSACVWLERQAGSPTSMSPARAIAAIGKALGR